MTNIAQQEPGRPDELPSPQPTETPPFEPDRIREPGSPETPPPEPEQPAERPPEYPVPDETSALPSL
ncbi:MAG: hypothetical protein ABJP02_09395 [Parasphingorhabdus sp.]|uniref:hypothetical protein n=1 Tax=Parasphingorhabdus sp. TaxID=2709688 RepID=UPI003298B3E2